MIDGMKRWLAGEAARPEAGVVDESVFAVRMVEPIRLETTEGQHMDLLRAVGITGRSKAELIRAALALALPALVANPDMVDSLQPGRESGNNGLDALDACPCASPVRRGNGR